MNFEIVDLSLVGNSVIGSVNQIAAVDSESVNNGSQLTASDRSAVDERAPAAKKPTPPKPTSILPAGITDVTIDHTTRFVFGMEPPTSPTDGVEAVRVITEITSSKGGPNVSVATLNGMQLRTLAKQFGITGGSKKTKWASRLAITSAIDSGSSMGAGFEGLRARGREPSPAGPPNDSMAYVDAAMAMQVIQPPAGSHELQMQRNAILRLSNVLFSPAYVQNFLSLNDKRDRTVQEKGIGARAEHFWTSIAGEFKPPVSEEVDEDHYGEIDLSLTTGDDAIKKRFNEAHGDPSDYTAVNINTDQLMVWTKQLIALRKSILGQDFMGKSGNHESDVYNYIVAAAKKASVLTKLGVFPIYYFLLKASHCEDFDKRFTPFLAPGMEGSSHKPGTAPASGKKRAQPEADDGLVTVMKQLVDSQQAAFEVQAESAKSKRHKESMRGRLQERQLALAERQQELAEAQQMVDLRGRLMGQLKEATALLATTTKGTPQYKAFKAMESGILAQMAGCADNAGTAVCDGTAVGDGCTVGDGTADDSSSTSTSSDD
jgi:hypothetical protein